MNQILGLINSLEHAIRYLLSGTAVFTILLLRLKDISTYIGWLESHPIITAFGIIALGFTVYTIYRMIFYVVGDGIAFQCGISAPCEIKNEDDSSRWNYALPYAKFLLWRHGKTKIAIVSDYLRLRWAMTHFTLIVAFMLSFALCTYEAYSIIDQCLQIVQGITIICFIVGFLQAYFLFRVERELYKKDKVKENSQDTQ